MSEHQSRALKHNTVSRRRLLAGITTAGTATLTGCNFCPRWPKPGDSHSNVPEVTGRGFDVAFGSVRVSAPAGVAPLGTAIVVSSTAPPNLRDVAAYASATGDPIDIEFGDNLQPAQPVTISFTIDPAQLGAPVSDDFPLIVVSTSEDARPPDYLNGTWIAETSTFTVVTDHLSPFSWLQIDLGKLVSDFTDRLLGFTFPKPSCAYVPADISGTHYSFVDPGDDSVWPCLNQSKDQIVVEMHNNSVLPWAVKSAPVAPGTVSGGFKDLGPGLAAVYKGLYGAMGDQRLALMPGNSVSLSFNPSTPPEIVQLKLDVGLYLASTLLYAVQSSLTIFFGGGGRVAETVLEGFDGLDCILEIQNTFYEMEDDGNLTGVVKSTLSCIPVLMEENLPKLSWKFIGKAILTVMNLLIGGASLIAGGIIGAYKTATSSDMITFMITASSPQATPSPVSTWPTNRDDGPSYLYVWLGANFFGFPDWIACDDATQYCLLGYTGKQHQLLDMSGPTVVAAVEDAATDPWGELKSLGLPDETINQILGP